jgi:hypothetical protein
MTANKPSRTCEDILAELPEADRAKAVEHIARAELALERDRLIGLLGPQIRQWIKEEVGLLANQINGNING